MVLRKNDAISYGLFTDRCLYMNLKLLLKLGYNEMQWNITKKYNILFYDTVCEEQNLSAELSFHHLILSQRKSQFSMAFLRFEHTIDVVELVVAGAHSYNIPLV